jgi:ABC-type nickel/cobalt efflux system permease component RcnA
MDMIQRIFTYGLTYLVIPVAVIMIAWGGISMAISAGNESKFKKGREIMTAAAIGLVIIFAAWLIISAVTNFLGIPNS